VFLPSAPAAPRTVPAHPAPSVPTLPAVPTYFRATPVLVELGGHALRGVSLARRSSRRGEQTLVRVAGQLFWCRSDRVTLLGECALG